MKIQRAFAVAAVALCALACQNQEKKVASASVLGTAAAPSDAEARQFAEAYIDALLKPNVPKAAQMIDWNLVLERATAGDDIGERWRRAALDGGRQHGHSFVTNLSQAVADGATLKLLRVHTVNGEKRAVIRLLLPNDGGVNYHEMPLVRDATGFVRARDIYIYATGEYLSETLRRLFLMAVENNPSLVEQLRGKKNMFAEHAPDYKTMMEKMREGDGHGAIAIYRRLPEPLRRDKAVMTVYVMASGSINDDAAYAKAMDELRAAHPNERGLDLMFIDSHILARRWDDALQTIDRVDRSVGGDPYLDVLRSEIHFERGELETAMAIARRACEEEPDLERAWWSRVTVALARKDHAETVRLLTHIRDELGVALADLTTIPEYAEFVRSSEYRQFAP